MISRKTIYDVHSLLERKPDDPKLPRISDMRGLSRHAKSSANILSRVTRQLDKHRILYKLDYKWPFHLIVYANGKVVSVYNSGFGNSIEIARLKVNGEPYEHNEKVFLTPEGTANYVRKI